MKYRKLGKTNFEVSEISIGTWQLGGGWGVAFNEKTAESILDAAAAQGINFVDTADVYNDGQSEIQIGKLLKKHGFRIYVASKAGRGLNPHTAAGYTPANVQGFIENSLRRLKLDCLDLIQLHCPPTEVYYEPELFFALERMKEKGLIRHYGVSVKKVEEALKAMDYPGLATVQIIFNMFRQRPAENFFKKAAEKNVGIIVRLPLASGLLTGNYKIDTVFNPNDHRFNNREGQISEKGETFSGVNYELGLKAVDELKALFPKRGLAEAALKFILMHNEVSCVIPGASRASQIESNAKVSDAAELSEAEMKAVRDIYDKYIRNPVHYLW
ncbi:MAG: aldo/keto reductase [Clostridiales bacterium]|jgi:aryl-alcohol dehydrogenase-like predicted oxidoreductase|nr:aldo/keto reductase [Clostridiales bacterium]